jgi:hypothetical protein
MLRRPFRTAEGRLKLIVLEQAADWERSGSRLGGDGRESLLIPEASGSELRSFVMNKIGQSPQ